MRTRRHGFVRATATIAALSVVAAACGSDDDEADSGDDAAEAESADADAGDDAGGDAGEDAGGDSGDAETPEGGEINVIIVGNPQMEDIAELTPELFTAETGISVNYSILEEGTLREIVTRDAAAGGDQFDVVMVGMFDTPQFGANGWLQDLTPLAEASDTYDLDDLIPSVRGGLSVDGALYSSPFYAESSFLMYRADVIEEAGLTMPDAPTWAVVAAIARAIDSDEMAGICLRGKPGWGDLGASFTTVLNTFGGTWWEANDDGSIGAAQVDQPEFREALQFYVDLIDDAGQNDAANSSFNECLSQYQDGQVAMWYDATVAAGILEADDSPVQGLNDFALAPTNVTDTSGWLWSWNLGIPTNSPNPDLAWEYIEWATSPGYIANAGELISGGWAAIPPGTRFSTYEIAEYQSAAESFGQKTLDAMDAAPIDDPGTTPRPGLPGVQYVGVPEFQDLGNQCTELFSSVIAGGTSIDDALSQCQDIASGFSS
ncbi:MAG: sugar ABC transporter substrate-binding protein [Actinomycetota bacterium]